MALDRPAASDDRKVALLTGAGTGIGSATARALAQRGANVVINHLGAQDAEAASETARACEALGVDALVLATDVGVPAKCAALVAQTIAAFGRVDYLVNNAGFSPGRDLKDLSGVTEDEFMRAFSVNSIGPFMLARAVAPHMRTVRGGSIVNVGSIAGLEGVGSSYPYLATKAALINLTRALARVLAPEIRVNVVCPGLVDTDFPRRVLSEERYEKTLEHWKSVSPLGSITQAEDIARTIIWLLEEAPQMTGEVVRVDGGAHLGSPR
jgi:3-oxoacyl-[acyl-carrier protein] reductase